MKATSEIWKHFLRSLDGPQFSGLNHINCYNAACYHKIIELLWFIPGRFWLSPSVELIFTWSDRCIFKQVHCIINHQTNPTLFNLYHDICITQKNCLMQVLLCFLVPCLIFFVQMFQWKGKGRGLATKFSGIKVSIWVGTQQFFVTYHIQRQSQCKATDEYNHYHVNNIPLTAMLPMQLVWHIIHNTKLS